VVTVKETAEKLIDAGTADDHSKDTFERFALKLNQKLESLAARN